MSHKGLVPLPGFENKQVMQQIPAQVPQPYYQNPHYQPFVYGMPYGAPNAKQFARPMPGATYNMPIVQNTEVPIEVDKDIEKTNKERKPRQKRGSIEGESVADLVRNVIKEDANLKQARGAFKKIVDILEDQRELSIFDDF